MFLLLLQNKDREGRRDAVQKSKSCLTAIVSDWRCRVDLGSDKDIANSLEHKRYVVGINSNGTVRVDGARLRVGFEEPILDKLDRGVIVIAACILWIAICKAVVGESLLE